MLCPIPLTHDPLLGQSNDFLEVLEQVSRLARLQKTVFVIGERGTGKELIARQLHYLSPRWQGPFVSLNCAALNENLLDSELFGHEAGAFTGAQKRHQGRFERADGGTLFLDELANAPMMRAGTRRRQSVAAGGCPAGLRYQCRSPGADRRFPSRFARQASIRCRGPTAVAVRPDDIMVMAEHFAIQMCRELGQPLFPRFSAEARRSLLDYGWPGNVRELKNVVERSLYHHNNSEHPLSQIIINPFDAVRLTPITPSTSSAPSLPLDLRAWLLLQEKQWLEQALARTHYQLRGMMKKHGIKARP
ncbi:phage shock protein operon transcriptional activator [Sodalis glossinidius str. 'morsitans']|uniref:Phage shock protein operon transcriptional activator n=1 Tax=Sodalis glossinidius (strain morsitans) TaxID=343509 RepID=Q2NSU7_SODGM|nr:phage shock protein operon transcriptional activator [Sodalis glossinidius str. 'morsitans']